MPLLRLVPVVVEVDNKDTLQYYGVFRDGVFSEFSQIRADKLVEFINAIVKFRKQPFELIGVEESQLPGFLIYEFDDFRSRYLNDDDFPMLNDALFDLVEHAPPCQLVPVVDKQDILQYYEVYEEGFLSKLFPRIRADKLAESINTIVNFQEQGTRPFVLTKVEQSEWLGILIYEFNETPRFLSNLTYDALFDMVEHSPF